MQVIICFAGGGTELPLRPVAKIRGNGEGRESERESEEIKIKLEQSYHPAPSDDEILKYMSVSDEDAITAVPDQIARAIIDRMLCPAFSAEIVQRLGVLLSLIVPVDSRQRTALMDMIMLRLGSGFYWPHWGNTS